MIVAFSCVYVYMLKVVFIVIPEQILTLIGISGGTALISRINAASKSTTIPKEIMDKVSNGLVRIPKLRNLISIDGRMNIYKFQMDVFTIKTRALS